MDTTDSYIKMCDWEELQELYPTLWKDPFWKEGVYWTQIDGVIHCSNWGDWGAWVKMGSKSSRLVWLPRQDQLQEMVGGHEQSRIDWIKWLEYTYSYLGYGNPFKRQNRFTSFEQEWLAFVMKEIHGKVWTGEKWENV